jgi:serine/threonine protein phosphatase PrpC
VSNPDEAAAVIARGGHIVNNRISNSLSLTPAIGDGSLADQICATPYTDQVAYDPGHALIIACDGVWDVLTDDEAAVLCLAAGDPAAGARAIKDAAVAKGSSDNVSVICVSCRPKT